MLNCTAQVLAAGICVFGLPAQAASLKTLYAFGTQAGDGENPRAPLAVANGTLFGTTVTGGTIGAGTVFSVNPATGAESVVYSFRAGNDAVAPMTPVTFWKRALYGTSMDGGQRGEGVIYRVNPANGAERVVHRFSGGKILPSSPLIPFAGHLLGTLSCGSVFSLDAADDKVTFLPCEKQRQGALSLGVVAVKGILYGANYEGGSPSDFGTLVAIDPQTGHVTVLHGFKGGSDGYGPVGAPVYYGGKLFGATFAGGGGNCQNGCGTVYSFDLDSGKKSILYRFQGGSDGSEPVSALTYWKGVLYGALNGPIAGIPDCPQDNNCGAIFSVDAATGVEKTVYAFTGGAHGYAPVVQPVVYNNALYGTTYRGGDSAGCGQNGTGCGTVYRLKP